MRMEVKVMIKLNWSWCIFPKRFKFQDNGSRFMSKFPDGESHNDSNSNSKDKNKKKHSDKDAKITKALLLNDITVPTNCCMSGCANCVWIEYAEKLSSILKHSSDDVQKVIMEKVQDPNMRAFLISELKVRM
ncbi:PREDICTED: uncharacterized protein LOC105366391 isoform X2 [Ceratosolen solmsi marchali]|uniref:Uncharacterized protein LOC105366391 isoform X2 n=1 Tax=Ceratosolen solmsi marchali TaxID=326594 RepID=A0AAJ6YRZ6_9HYME|nr:PREDICTED: uncharacterized protein LOC105366391 isoform X2 [Ceratosolen solmsi marchali]